MFVSHSFFAKSLKQSCENACVSPLEGYVEGGCIHSATNIGDNHALQ
jgi:hypothetical protein